MYEWFSGAWVVDKDNDNDNDNNYDDIKITGDGCMCWSKSIKAALFFYHHGGSFVIFMLQESFTEGHSYFPGYSYVIRKFPGETVLNGTWICSWSSYKSCFTSTALLSVKILFLTSWRKLNRWTNRVHYRLRSIKWGQFRFSNFTSHFKQKSYFHFLIH